MQSPVIEAPADVDPRQFLVDVKGAKEKQELEVQLTYTVCDDVETFCRTMKQTYIISIDRDPNGGSRPGIFMPAMFARVREFDKNKDGKITKAELPAGRRTLYIGHMDYNANDIIEMAEVDQFLKMFNNGRGFDSEKNDGVR